MKKLIFLLLLVGLCFVWPLMDPSVSQAGRLARQSTFGCGTSPAELSKLALEMGAGTNDLDEATVRLFFHLMCDTNGVGWFNEAHTDSIVDMLDEIYNPHGIYFCNSGYDSIYSDFYYNDPHNDSVFIDYSDRLHSNAIDLFVYGYYGAQPWGTAGDIPSSNLLVYGTIIDDNGDSSFAALSPVTAHELGHSLGLYHTFEWGFGYESITRDPMDSCYNCDVAGDLVCDTKADYSLLSSGYGYVSGCTLVNSLPGLCDSTEEYDPDIANIMSYYKLECKDSLSTGQGERMLDVLGSSQVLEFAIDRNCCIGIRGNANGDPQEKILISDVTYLTSYLFGIPNGPAPPCLDEGDANGDYSINISDVTFLQAYLFSGGPAPPSCDNNCQ